MKLKVKHICNVTVAHRVEVPNGCCLAELKQALVEQLQVLPSASAADVVVSLNKKDSLSGDDTAALSSLGVCNGDLLWILAPALLPAAPQPAAAGVRSSVPASGSGGAAMASPAGPMQQQVHVRIPAPVTASCTAAAAAAGMAVDVPESSIATAAAAAAAAAAAGDVEMADADRRALVPAHGATGQDAEGNATTGDAAAAEAAAAADTLPEVQHPLAKPWVPDHLQRLLSLLTDQQQQQKQLGVNQAQLLVLTVHAAMLESGFQPWQRQAAAEVLGDAAGSSSAAELLQRQQQLLLPVLQGSSSVYTLSYLLPGDTAEAAGKSTAATAAGRGSTPAAAAAGVCIEVKAVDVGHHLVLAGSLRTATSAAAGASSGNATGGGGSSSSSKRVLSLSIPKSHVTLLQSSTQGAGLSAAAGVPDAGTADAGGNAAATAAASSANWQTGQDPSASDKQQQQQPGWPLCAFTGLQQLWVLLKDRLCLPLLVAGCAAAGLAAPVGLDSLPYEMQEAVLALLGAKHLAALCCSCTPLRHRASTDTLWKPLFDKEFPQSPNPSSSSSSSHGVQGPLAHALNQTLNQLRQQAGRQGWKWAFGAAWVQRARVQEESRRRARGVLLPGHIQPYPTPMPWGPFRPTHPTMPPNIIGGDYDRFPSVGFGGSGGLGFGGGMRLEQDAGVGLGSGGAIFSGGGSGVGALGFGGARGPLPGRGSGGLGGGLGPGGMGVPGLGRGRRREGGGGSGFRLY